MAKFYPLNAIFQCKKCEKEYHHFEEKLSRSFNTFYHCKCCDTYYIREYTSHDVFVLDNNKKERRLYMKLEERDKEDVFDKIVANGYNLVEL